MERLCNKTEFEIEGWRKIPPLMDILEDHFSMNFISKMKLKMMKQDIERKPSIRESWIYDHFASNDTKNIKIALYVNAFVPIDDSLDAAQINSVENHCVVVKKLKKRTINGRTYEWLKLDKTSHFDKRSIPVDLPFFEEVQNEVLEKIGNKGKDAYGPALKRYGKKLAENKLPFKFDMIFIRSRSPCFLLEFTS